MQIKRDTWRDQTLRFSWRYREPRRDRQWSSRGQHADRLRRKSRASIRKMNAASYTRIQATTFRREPPHFILISLIFPFPVRSRRRAVLRRARSPHHSAMTSRHAVSSQTRQTASDSSLTSHRLATKTGLTSKVRNFPRRTRTRRWQMSK